MGKTIVIRTDESLVQVLERIRKEVATDIKARYNLNEIIVNGTFASQVMAAKMNGAKSLNFTIKKIGMNKGILEIL